MWYGWGTGTCEQNWRATLTEMKARLREPWMLHACLPGHLEACRELGLLGKAIYFPYNLVESEPSAPLTDLRLAKIAEAAALAHDERLCGLQGNAQTPLAQLPNIAAIARAGWVEEPPPDAATILEGLAGQLLVRDAQVLKQGWLALSSEDVENCAELARRLRELAAVESARGPLALIVGEWQALVMSDLATMLEIHAAAVRFADGAADGAAPQECAGLLGVYFRQAAAWLEHTGYHNVRIVDHESYRHNVAARSRHCRRDWGRNGCCVTFMSPRSPRRTGPRGNTLRCDRRVRPGQTQVRLIAMLIDGTRK